MHAGMNALSLKQPLAELIISGKKTIERGMKWKSADGRKWHAERGGTEAVFMKEGDIFVIITTYLGRRTK